MPNLPETFWDMTDGAKLLALLIIGAVVVMLAGMRYLGRYLGRKITTATHAARAAGEEAKTAGVAAEVAAVRSLPTSNGFAAGVREDLALIIASQAAVRADVADLKEHTRRLDGRLDRLENTRV